MLQRPCVPLKDFVAWYLTKKDLPTKSRKASRTCYGGGAEEGVKDLLRFQFGFNEAFEWEQGKVAYPYILEASPGPCGQRLELDLDLREASWSLEEWKGEEECGGLCWALLSPPHRLPHHHRGADHRLRPRTPQLSDSLCMLCLSLSLSMLCFHWIILYSPEHSRPWSRQKALSNNLAPWCTSTQRSLQA